MGSGVPWGRYLRLFDVRTVQGVPASNIRCLIDFIRCNLILKKKVNMDILSLLSYQNQIHKAKENVLGK